MIQTVEKKHPLPKVIDTKCGECLQKEDQTSTIVTFTDDDLSGKEIPGRRRPMQHIRPTGLGRAIQAVEPQTKKVDRKSIQFGNERHENSSSDLQDFLEGALSDGTSEQEVTNFSPLAIAISEHT